MTGQVETLVDTSQVGPEGLPLQRGQSIGRYLVLARLGAGAMGVVYAAYDPELDRKVALKLLHSGERTLVGTEGRTRLIREAQAIARLNHPNVITVYDAGAHEGRVFLAMEFVDGSTLSGWLRAERRTWRDVLATFVRAGRGLEAAHAAGIVHRDFKPANVMVGDDGRVRVMDFGLARAATDPTERGPEARLDESRAVPGVDALGADLTRRGSSLGTPAYMAPEQHVGMTADVCSDQFSFGVALYEGLYGERPFAGDTLPVIAANVTQGKVREAPAQSRVPTWVRRVVLRALAVDPAQRFPSVGALLNELERDRGARLRRIGFLFVGVLGLGGVATVAQDSDDAAERCLAPDALAGTWDDARKRSVEQAFAATGLGFADHVAGTVSGTLDIYARRWLSIRQKACLAAHVRFDRSAVAYDLQMACLERRKGEVRALVDVLADADAQLAKWAVGAAAGLTPPEVCEDLERLSAAVPEPEDPKQLEQVRSVRQRLAQAIALDLAGRAREGLPLAREVTNEANATGYAPLLAHALFVRAKLEGGQHDEVAAVATLLEALRAAAEGRDDGLTAQIMIQLVAELSRERTRNAEALVWAEAARAAILRTGNLPHRRLALENNVGNVYDAQGHHAEAIDHYRTALELARSLEDATETARVLVNIGVANARRGNYVEARDAMTEGLAGFQALLSDDHPTLGQIAINLANVHEHLGDLEAALATAQRGTDTLGRALGHDHLDFGLALTVVGDITRKSGDLAGAERAYGRAVSIFEGSEVGRRHPMFAETLADQATVHAEDGNIDQAQQLFARAVEEREATPGSDPPEVAGLLVRHAELLQANARVAEAVSLYQRALALALPATERDPDDHVTRDILAQIRFGLARAASRNGQRARARELVALSKADLERIGEFGAEALAEVERWEAETLR